MTELHRKHPWQSRLKLMFGCGVVASAVMATGEWDDRHHALARGVLPATAAIGQTSGPTKASELVTVRTMADTEAIAPGQTFHLAVIFDIRDKWHTYWINPGSSGAPTSAKVQAPEGFTIGEMRFPRPWTNKDSVGVTYGYEKQAVHFIPVTAPESLDRGEASFTLDVFYLVCQDRCLMGDAKQTVTLPTRPTEDRGTVNKTMASTGSAEDTALLERFRKRLPKPIDALVDGAARLDGSTLVITGRSSEHGATASFLPIERPGISFGKARSTVKADGAFTVRVPVEIKANNMTDGERPKIEGVLTLGRSLDDPSYDVSVALPEHTARGN